MYRKDASDRTDVIDDLTQKIVRLEDEIRMLRQERAWSRMKRYVKSLPQKRWYWLTIAMLNAYGVFGAGIWFERSTWTASGVAWSIWGAMLGFVALNSMHKYAKLGQKK